MKKIFYFLTLLLMAMLCASCGGRAQPTPDPAQTAAVTAAPEGEANQVKEAKQPKATAQPKQTGESAKQGFAKDDVSDAALRYAESIIKENGVYTTPATVAAYIDRYNKLPSNYITKKEAASLGWDSSEGNLDDIAKGKSIGGDSFGNREGRLPKGKYRECDVNYEGGYRGAERIIYSADGDVYYTNDHYKTFKKLY